MDVLYTALCLVAIALMGLALYQAFKLNRYARGGWIGSRIKIILIMISLFFFGYLLAPFFPQLPIKVANFAVVSIFIGGAIYVLIVLNLISNLIKQIKTELNLD